MPPVEDLSGVFRVTDVYGEVTELGKDNKRVPITKSTEFLQHVGVEITVGAFLAMVPDENKKVEIGLTSLESGAVEELNSFDGEVAVEELAEPNNMKAGSEHWVNWIRYKVT